MNKDNKPATNEKEQTNQGQFELVHYEKDGISLDVKVSRADGTAWLSIYDLSILYGMERTAILYHVRSVLKSDKTTINRVTAESATAGSANVSVCEKFSQTGPDGKAYKVTHYRLEVLPSIDVKLNSRNGYLLKEFIDEYMRKSRGGHNDIIIYNNGNVSLAVNVSPEEETVWLSAAQIALLFDVSADNVYLHIRNIIDDGELGGSVTEDSSVTAPFHRKMPSRGSDGKTYNIDFYNLDIVMTVGYRVRSKRAMEFRAWANSILRNYLLKGYALDDNRTLVTNDNYVNLIHRVDSIDARVSTLERLRVVESGRVFYNGSFFDAREFIKGLVSGAKESIILIDPYSDARTLDFLKQRPDGVKIKLYTSSKAELTKIDVASFNRQYGGLTVFKDDTFHDRFMAIDGSLLYHIGASLNYAGSKTFAVTVIEDENVLLSLMVRIKEAPILMG